MNIGVPKERRIFEYRVGLSPAMVQLLTHNNHTVYVEHEAGLGAGFSDEEYATAGGKIVYSPEEVFGRADLLLKVARPLLEEISWLRPGTAIVGLLHMASARQDKIQGLLSSEITAIALEQIQLNDGSLPVLRPLSQIGGRLAAQISARLLQNNSGGKGILIGGIVGVPPAEVVVIGAGVVGTWATLGFLGMGAHVTVLDTNLNALQQVDDRCPGVVTMISNPHNIAKVCQYADIIVGAILVPNERPPIIITREMVKTMKPRSVIMDISIDEGGCVETSRPTTHEKSYYVDEGVIHYCVPNIPSVVARTATHAFLNAAFPYILEMANKGIEKAIEDNPALERAVNIHSGRLIHLAHLPYPEIGE
jgi:alanine dehydrogenase